MRVVVRCVVSTASFNTNALRLTDFVFVISVFVALCAIESAVAVNPDLRLELYVRPQTASWSTCVVRSILGGDSSVRHDLRHAGPSCKDSRPPSWNSE